MGYKKNMVKKQLRFMDQIRAALVENGDTRYAISKATGIPQSALSRFVHGKATMREAALNRLAEYLKLEVVVRASKRNRAGQRPAG